MGLRDYVTFISWYTGLHTFWSPSNSKYKNGIRDYAYCNPKFLTCVSWDYGITGLHTFWLPSISKYENGISGLRIS